MEQIITHLRQNLYPPGYQSYSFRRYAIETSIDALRSVMATLTYRDTIKYYVSIGVQFDMHFYVPEVLPSTGRVYHERADHGHLLKCIAGILN